MIASLTTNVGTVGLSKGHRWRIADLHVWAKDEIDLRRRIHARNVAVGERANRGGLDDALIRVAQGRVDAFLRGDVAAKKPRRIYAAVLEQRSEKGGPGRTHQGLRKCINMLTRKCLPFLWFDTGRQAVHVLFPRFL